MERAEAGETTGKEVEEGEFESTYPTYGVALYILLSCSMRSSVVLNR